MTVLIAGAGIGGLAAALALDAKGIEVKLFDRAPDLGEVGAGIQLAANSTRLLFALGLRDQLEQVAFQPQSVDLRRFNNGKLVSRVRLADHHLQRYGAPYLQVHRGDLHTLLRKAVCDRLGGDAIETGCEVSGYAQTEKDVSLNFIDGRTFVGDLLIGADGIHSAVQKQMNGPDKPAFTGHVAWRGVVPADKVKHLSLDPVTTSWMAPHAHAVTYFLRGGELVNFVGITETHDWADESWTQAADRAQLQAAFADWHPTVRGLIDEIERPFKWALYTRNTLPRWSDGRVTLLGDACHPMLPYMAQGAGMAIEDAWILANCLSGRDDKTGALQQYQQLRIDRTSRVQKTARANGRLFHLSNKVMRFGVYGGMSMGSRIAPALVERRFDWLMGYDASTVGQ